MTPYTLTIFLALVTHQWLKRWDPVDVRIATPVVALMPGIPMLYMARTEQSTAFSMACILLIFQVTLLGSVVGYRLSPYHPLAAYPGPTMMKITKLWAVWIAVSGKTHLYVKALHDKYGPVVRIGPNELSTVEKDFLPHIIGGRGMPKGPMWDGRRASQAWAPREYDNLIDIRNPELHLRLRKPWNKAFSAGPLKDYEVLLLPRLQQVIGHLRSACNQSQDGVGGKVNMVNWFKCFTFDIMGDVAFGGCFELMKDEDKDGWFDKMAMSLHLRSVIQHVPWISQAMRYFPKVNKSMMDFVVYTAGKATARYNMKMQRKDLFYHIAEASGTEEMDLSMIKSHAPLALVAGSDTVAFTLSTAMYLLLSNPGTYRRLRDEVDETFKKYDIPDMDSRSTAEDTTLSTQVLHGEVLSSHMPYLNAVINETMRLFPAVPTAFQRTPALGSGGKLLQNESCRVFLPEGNMIIVPPYVLHRNPRYFSPAPDSFIPERWLDSEKNHNDSATEFVTSRDAFVPFSLGQQNCVGRPFALLEMRYLISMLIRNFDMELDLKVCNKGDWEAQVDDRYTFQSSANLPVIIKRRERIA